MTNYNPFWHWEVTLVAPGKFHLSLFESCQHHLWCHRTFKTEKRAHNFAARISQEIYSYGWLFEYGDEAIIQAFDKHFIYVEREWVVYRQWLIQIEEWLGDFTVTLNDPIGNPIVQPVVRDEIFVVDEAAKEAIALIDRIEFSRCTSPGQLSLF